MVAAKRPKGTKFISIGPGPVPVVPIGDFSKIYLKGQLEELWTIIGPSVELNIARLPLWKVITMAYLEGAMHGSQMVEDERYKGNPKVL
jgi:hypothetical protein